MDKEQIQRLQKNSTVFCYMPREDREALEDNVAFVRRVIASDMSIPLDEGEGLNNQNTYILGRNFVEKNDDGDSMEEMQEVFNKYGIGSIEHVAIINGKTYWIPTRIELSVFNVKNIRIAAKHNDKFNELTMSLKTWAETIFKRNLIVRGEGLTIFNTKRVGYFTQAFKGAEYMIDKESNWSWMYDNIKGWDFTAITIEQMNNEKANKPRCFEFINKNLIEFYCKDGGSYIQFRKVFPDNSNEYITSNGKFVKDEMSWSAEILLANSWVEFSESDWELRTSLCRVRCFEYIPTNRERVYPEHIRFRKLIPNNGQEIVFNNGETGTEPENKFTAENYLEIGWKEFPASEWKERTNIRIPISTYITAIKEAGCGDSWADAILRDLMKNIESKKMYLESY